MDDTRIHRLPPPADLSSRHASTAHRSAEAPGATVVQMAAYRAQRAARVKALPLFDDAEGVSDDGLPTPTALPAPAARALSDRDVAHRQRMLRHLLEL